MPNPTVRASAIALPNSNLPRRGFLRQLCGLPLIGGGLSLIGAPSAVAEPVTPALIGAYARWLELERFLLIEEMPRVSLIERAGQGAIERLRRAGHYADADAIARAEARIAEIQAEFEAEFCHFRARARLGGADDLKTPVDRFYFTPDMAIVSPPASTRAALVLSAVGCDWRS